MVTSFQSVCYALARKHNDVTVKLEDCRFYPVRNMDENLQ